MYRAFNLGDIHFKSDVFAVKGASLIAANKSSVTKALDAFLLDGKPDGSKMTENWFPEIKADVFISHSHKDRRLALELAGWLSTQLHITAFIDSAVWGSADNLLKNVDDALCFNPGGQTNSYEKRNESTSHVHMMLATALAKMIDKPECVIFVSTPNSITVVEAIEKTCSAWIFYELATVGQTRRRVPAEHRPTLKEAAFGAKRALDEILIEYEVDISALTTIGADTLNKWGRQFEEELRDFPLDILYEIAPE
jgi:hypothetical protein